MTNRKQSPGITDRLAAALGDEAETVETHYEQCYQWMITKGKDPYREKPLRDRTATNYVKRLDRIHRQIVEHIDPIEPTTIQTDHADDYLLLIDRGDITKQTGGEYGESSKRKLSDTLKKYFEWRYDTGAIDAEWQPKINFRDSKQTTTYRFSYRELGQLLNTAEAYGSLPSYYSTSGDERDRINSLVAQRRGTKKDDVTRQDWLRADQSSKIYSLVTVGHDAGLAPVEVGEADPCWYDPQQQVFRIPTEKACKQREKEEVALSDEAADALSQWIKERRHLEVYDDTSNLWLNNDGNPYSSGNLCYLIRQLCGEAGIETDGKNIRWYSLRYTMGQKLTAEGELSEANDQLRHNVIESTKQYDKTPLGKLKNRVNEAHEKAANAAADPTYDPYAESQAESTTDQKPQYPDEVVTPTGDGGVHIDAVIKDTPEDRIDITHEILEDAKSEGDSSSNGAAGQ